MQNPALRGFIVADCCGLKFRDFAKLLTPSISPSTKLMREALTFDDVLLVPRKSRVLSRKDVSLKTNLTKNIALSIPLVSANMDSVTESRMARFMAEAGGIGIIHRFMPKEREAEEVRRVKRAENIIIEDPYTIHPEQTAGEARDLMTAYGVSGLLVTDAEKNLLGIITSRDLWFAGNPRVKVKLAMSKNVISAPVSISASKAKGILYENRIKKLPLVSRAGKIKGLITLKDIVKKSKNPNASKDRRGRLLVGAAVGVKPETYTRAKALLDAGADVLVIDIAHGHHKHTLNTLKMLKKRFSGVEIVAGNVATPEAVRDLARAGADAVKIGIGPGAACTTRVVTGVGMPQLTAIVNAVREAKKFSIPLIADGGARTSGDFAKALAAGADTLMAGSLFAGTDESPGEYVIEDGSAYKLYRGMASREAGEDKIKIDGGGVNYSSAPEGKAGRVSYRGSAAKVVDDLIAGLRSSMSYLGAKNLKEFQKNAEFVKITSASFKEGQARN